MKEQKGGKKKKKSKIAAKLKLKKALVNRDKT